MPSFNTDLYDDQKSSRTNTSRLAAPNVASGDVQFAIIPYTLAGTEAAADTINLCVLPEDVIPIPALSSIVCSADPGTTLTMDVGTAANLDGWFDGVTLSSGGKVEATSGTMPAWIAQTALVPDTGKGTADVVATVASANTLTADVVLYFILAYKLGRGA